MSNKTRVTQKKLYLSATVQRLSRCACCHKWPDRLGGIGVFVPKDGGAVVDYALCPSCARRLQRNPQDQAALRRIEAYVAGLN
ncbi:MAG: hypothetical protein U0350_02495 [Caldilineaceae bacterium]